jgi:putative DNA primase/helicase
VFLPPASNGGKQGADDFLAAGGTLSEMKSLARPLANSTKPHASKFNFSDDIVFTGDYNGIILARHLEGKAFYVRGLGWLWFDGRRFVNGEAHVIEYARNVFRGALAECAQEPDSARRLKLAKWYSQSLDNYRLKNALEFCETDARTRAEVSEFDSNPLLFNCANGTLNLETGELQPHSPADKLTKLSPVNYKPKAAMFDWLEFLERVVPEVETRNFLQRAAGYTLTGKTSEQCLFWLHGVGKNGKSTFVEALAYVLGDYATGADFQSFTERRNEGVGDMAGWQGARMVASAEYDKGRRVNESLLKNITGGDRFRVRLLYRDAFDIHPQFKLWASFNDKPIISGTDEGIWRRVRLIPFDVTIPEEERDKKLGERLQKYADGILCWMLEGCLAWQMQGLGTASAVQRATNSYRGESDVFAAWLDECCVVQANTKHAAGDLYANYKRWAAGNAERELTQTEFGKRMAARGFEKTRGHGGLRLWVGVTLPIQPEINSSW